MQKGNPLQGKQVLITGATSGIGLAAAEGFAKRGAKLAIVARNETKARGAAARIEAAGDGSTSVDILFADLASQESVRRLAAEVLARYPKLDVLANNAGAYYAERQLSKDGIELTWAVNHLAPFLLTTLLLERLQESAPARVVVTAGELHRLASPIDERTPEGTRHAFARYCQSKLANILFTVELARRLEHTGVTANCFHPGFTATGFATNNGAFAQGLMSVLNLFARSPEKGAETLVWLAGSPDVADITRGYFIDKRRRTPAAKARDENAAQRLWQMSDQLTDAAGAAP